MFQTGSRLWIGAAALAAVGAIVYGVAQGGSLGTVGLIFAVLLEILWIGRLVGGSADDVALLVPAALAGLVANPLWYVLVGRELAATARARAA